PREPGVFVIDPTSKPKRRDYGRTARQRTSTKRRVPSIEHHVSGVGGIDDEQRRAQLIAEPAVIYAVGIDDVVRRVRHAGVHVPEQRRATAVEFEHGVELVAINPVPYHDSVDELGNPTIAPV